MTFTQVSNTERERKGSSWLTKVRHITTACLEAGRCTLDIHQRRRGAAQLCTVKLVMEMQIDEAKIR